MKFRCPGSLKQDSFQHIEFIRESLSALKYSGTSGETVITVLVENHREPALANLLESHGISLWVERKGRAFLLDLGPDQVYARNAASLNKEIASADFAFISHGHYDHGGGIFHFLQTNGKAPVYIKKKAVTERHYSRRGWVYRDRSVPESEKLKDSERLHFTGDEFKIEPDIVVIPRIQRIHPLPRGNRSLYKKSGGKMVPDDFDHEQLLVIKDSDGLIVFSGCCHNGVLNVVETVVQKYPDTPIKAVMGGFHLYNPTRNRMAESPDTVKTLGLKMRDCRVGRFLTGHCTGLEAYSILKPLLKQRLHYFSTGMQFSL